MLTPTPIKITLEEYLALPETTLPHELVDGELRVTAAPSTWHQTVLNRVARALEDFVEPRNLGLLFRAAPSLLGAMTLEGLGLRVDPLGRRLSPIEVPLA
jgi:hypothetical protein